MTRREFSLVERLRRRNPVTEPECHEAADTIAAQEKRIAEWAALAPDVRKLRDEKIVADARIAALERLRELDRVYVLRLEEALRHIIAEAHPGAADPASNLGCISDTANEALGFSNTAFRGSDEPR